MDIEQQVETLYMCIPLFGWRKLIGIFHSLVDYLCIHSCMYVHFQVHIYKYTYIFPSTHIYPQIVSPAVDARQFPDIWRYRKALIGTVLQCREFPKPIVDVTARGELSRKLHHRKLTHFWQNTHGKCQVTRIALIYSDVSFFFFNLH